jgi:proline iminopeptidase
MKFNMKSLKGLQVVGMAWNSLLGMFGSDKAYQKIFRQVLINYNKGFKSSGNMSVDLSNVRANPINKTRKYLNNYPVLPAMQDPGFRITITYGDKDIYGKSKRYLNERFPTASIITMKNCGHLPALHSKEKFAMLLHEHFINNIVSLTQH